MRLPKFKKFRWPLCWRKTIDELEAKQYRTVKHSYQAHMSLLAECTAQVQKLLPSLIRLECRHDRDYGQHSLTIALDRLLMQNIATQGDLGQWRFVAEQVSRCVERELQTMNFAGFNQRAYEAERERYSRCRDFHLAKLPQ